MEELVANELEPRHRFLLDVLLRMNLIEEELETLEDTLDEEEEGEKKDAGGEKEGEEKSGDATEEKDASEEEVLQAQEGVEEGKEESGAAEESSIRAMIDENARLEEELLAKLQEEKEAKAAQLLQGLNVRRKSRAFSTAGVSGLSQEFDFENADVIMMSYEELQQELEKVTGEISHATEDYNAAAKEWYAANRPEGEDDRSDDLEYIRKLYADHNTQSKQLYDELLAAKEKRAAALKKRLESLRSMRGAGTGSSISVLAALKEVEGGETEGTEALSSEEKAATGEVTVMSYDDANRELGAVSLEIAQVTEEYNAAAKEWYASHRREGEEDRSEDMEYIRKLYAENDSRSKSAYDELLAQKEGRAAALKKRLESLRSMRGAGTGSVANVMATVPEDFSVEGLVDEVTVAQELEQLDDQMRKAVEQHR